ncbi:MAG TPA: hypothetical protein VMY42_05705 [Thermoguttaceae bacterium]|nr:hypothetical protein [Thermoguttaceae bacterium]
MAEASPDIDRIVREVLAELGHAPAGVARAEEDDAAARSGLPTNGELVITCRVVTLSEVADRLDAIHRLVVPPKAVLTPAVRDELQRRNIAIDFAEAAPERTAGSLRLVLIAVGKRVDPAALAAVLRHEGLNLEQHSFDCLIAATDRLAAEVVRPDTLGLLLTGHTAAALCLANRHGGVRAVSGSDARAVSTAATSVGANLLAIDPAIGSLHQLKQMVTEFTRGGVRPCPEVFQAKLH